MIACPVCQHQEYEGTLFCSECGSQLWRGAPRAVMLSGDLPGTMRFPSDKLRESAQAQPETAQRPATDPQEIAIRVQGALQTVRLGHQQEYRLGRAEPGQPATPDLDLSPYRAQELGVSRLHAMLKLDGSSVTLTDLGSTNGTLVNGVRLAPHASLRLRDGDELRLGKLALRIFFETTPPG